jgi:uncharacterized protein (DUF983 family)
MAGGVRDRAGAVRGRGHQPMGTSRKMETLMKKVNVKCPVCGECGKLVETEIGQDHECYNCRQTVRLVPESSQVRTAKFLIKLAGVGILFLIALSILLQKL